jgi:hypothetical protein
VNDGVDVFEAEVADEVRRLGTLNLEALRLAWRRRYGPPPRLRSADLLRRLLSWRIQSEALGGLPVETRRALARTSAAPRRPKLEAGVRLMREWRGVRHEVEMMQQGVLYRGQAYASLSEVARTITGTRWNGPRFFGLRSEPRA